MYLVGNGQPVTEAFPTQRVSPSGQEGSESSTVIGAVSLDSAWKKKEGKFQRHVD